MTISLVGVLIIFLVIGVAFYLIKAAPVDDKLKNIFHFVLLAFVLIWLLSLLTGVGPAVFRIG